MRLAIEYAADLKKEFQNYNRRSFSKDLLSGITVAAVALPLALAFGVGSGADAAAGLITAIISAFLISALSGASFQISGPTGAMTAILIPLVTRYGLETLFAACFLAGILLVLAGLFRLGSLVYFLPHPVIAGFTSGIAVIIALGQVGNLLGIPLPGENALARVYYGLSAGVPPNLYALGIGLFVIILIAVWPQAWNNRFPGSLAAVIAASAISVLFKFPLETVGSIPQTLIHSKHLTAGTLSQVQPDVIFLPALSISLLCMIEGLLCGAAGGRMKGERMNANRELVAQGIGNILLPFFGGVPATAAIARTSVAIKSGCQTRLTGIIQGVVLLMSMFLLSPLMSRIPIAALAGVLMMTAWRMNDWNSIQYLFRRKFKGGITKFMLTMLTTVVFDLTIAIVVGVLFSIALFIVKTSDLQVTVSELDTKRLGLSSQIKRHIQVVYVTGVAFFGSLDQLESGLSKANGQVLIISMRGVPFLDLSTVSFLLEYCQARRQEGVSVLFSSIQPSVRTMMDRAGITDVIGSHAYYQNAKDAILAQID